MRNATWLAVFILSIGHGLYCQIDANSLLGLPSATTAQRNAIVGPREGAMVYDSDVNRVYEFTASGWQELLTTGNIYTGAFQISASGAINVTGIPFRPTSISFVAHANVENFDLDSDNGTVDNDRGIRNSFGTMNGFSRDDGGTITQQVIYVGAHGNSINDISRYASSSHAIGLRYGDQNGRLLGRITGSVATFNTDGFTINVNYENGVVDNASQNVLPTDINSEGVIVLFTAYR
ncbi:hypothetical protein J8281_17650 [Aquimarina sp. U1-2]|uniref:hypothetical protein n=1 Tax=Aquimarina sp. U1-2 TaxID=2823141 RepID=UPI001AECBEFB|nr:hypothetical protein [Aquimarina sp. U1-2]MBP2834025.1 hypothetical protein [Aquimarina sp. U1-2]